MQRDIFKVDYYVELYGAVLGRFEMTEQSIATAKHDRRDLCRMWNYFWGALPDSVAIRRSPFFDICDLCEANEDDHETNANEDDHETNEA